MAFDVNGGKTLTLTAIFCICMIASGLDIQVSVTPTSLRGLRTRPVQISCVLSNATNASINAMAIYKKGNTRPLADYRSENVIATGPKVSDPSGMQHELTVSRNSGCETPGEYVCIAHYTADDGSPNRLEAVGKLRGLDPPGSIFMAVKPRKDAYSDNEWIEVRCWSGYPTDTHPLWNWKIFFLGAAPSFVSTGHDLGGQRALMNLRVPEGDTKMTISCSTGDEQQARSFTLQKRSTRRCGRGYYGDRCSPCSELREGVREAECGGSCPPGFHGPHCELTCGHCALGTCLRWTAVCPSGCLPGWMEPRCDTPNVTCEKRPLCPSFTYELELFVPAILVAAILLTAVLTLVLNSLCRRGRLDRRRDFSPLPLPRASHQGAGLLRDDAVTFDLRLLAPPRPCRSTLAHCRRTEA